MKENVAVMKNEYLYYLLHKPFGYLSQFTSNDRHKKYLHQLYPFPSEVKPVGRLDEDSEGMLILTSDGKCNHFLISNPIPKTYFVLVEGSVTPEQLLQLSNGVMISYQNVKYLTKPCEAFIINDPLFVDRIPRVRYHHKKQHTWLSITIKEGKYRQVRKMTAAIGCPTLRLVRTSIGNLALHEFEPGKVVQLNLNEITLTGYSPAIS